MIELQAGELLCRIEPALGGCITALSSSGVPVLRPAPGALASARQAGSYPLVPFSNRVAHASLQWEGTLYPLVRNNGDEPHAIHGVGWQRPWEVLECGRDFALLSYEHRADTSWPFAFDSSQGFRLANGCLEMTLSVTNQSARQAPAGLGWHPFFVKRPGARLAFVARGRWEMGADKLPTRRVESPGLDADCATLDVDHCFDGWERAVTLRGGGLDIRITSNLTRLVVFTTPDREHIAIEPVSHVNNAAALVAGGADASELGLVTLEPGESLSAQMAIEVEHHA